MKGIAMVMLLVLVGVAGCMDNGGSDRDEDGLENADEEAGWTIIIDLMDRRISRGVTSDPDRQDTDGDGLLDAFEFALSMDPRSKDTDEDGLSDCQEVMHTNRSECEDPEWEGVTDGGYKTIGNNADSDPHPTRYKRDHVEFVDETGTLERLTWGDGIPDGEEIEGYRVQVGARSRTIHSDPLKTDSDGDYLEDGEERFLYGADPTVADTDGDGCVDGLDPIPDAEERFDIGVESFTWERPGESGSREIQLLLHLADNGFNVHPTSGITAEHGQEVELSGEEIPIVSQAYCTFPPWHPWVRVSVQAREIDGGQGGRGVDLTSHDVPNDVGAVWWNVRDGRFHFDAERQSTTDEGQAFEPEDGRLRWSGLDGEVTLRPQVLK